MILILGKNGYISKRFQDYFDYKNIKYVASSLRPKNYPLNDKKYSLIINCLGYTGNPNVDSCEDHKEETLYVNAMLAEFIAENAKKTNVPLIHVSSGCIYNNVNNTSYEYPENIKPDFSFFTRNSSWYSGTKALGESLVSKTWNKSYICRLRMPFNHLDESKNYISKILKYPKVLSIENSLTNVDEFVKCCYLLYEKEAPYGTYNITNPGGITAKEVLEIAKEYGIKKSVYEYFESLEEFNKIVKAPRSNCVLSTKKLEELGLGLTNVRESLKKCFEKWNEKNEKIFW